VPTVWRTPGYPVFVGVLTEAVGLTLGAVYAAQVLLDLWAIILVAILGWGTGGRPVALGAAWLLALNPFTAVFAGQIMTESLTAWLLAVLVWITWRMWLRGETTSRHWVAIGLLLGVSAMVRPALAALPGGLALVLLTRFRWREWMWVMTLVALGWSAIIGPWAARNWFVTRDGGADSPFHVISYPLEPFYRPFLSPGFTRWYMSFEEPFIWDRPAEPPAVARYFLPGEKETTEELFRRIAAAGMTVSPDVDAEFKRLYLERRSAHPLRTVVLPPISRAVRLWVTARLSAFGLETVRLQGMSGQLMVLSAIAFNTLVALLGFGMALAWVRRPDVHLLALVPVYLTVAHSLIFLGNQSRYTAPALPEVSVLAALGGVTLYRCARLRLRRAVDARN
jgi:4-amino-4-deoxy-L-arabinose transferase-like glycosyltransferase